MALLRKTVSIAVSLAALTVAQSPAQGQSGSGTSTRYWDCCKPACAWPGHSDNGIVGICDAQDQPLKDQSAESGCTGGPAYMCSSQTPWAINDNLAYGFAAVSTTNTRCCECWELTFTDGPAKGKKMVVQATNTGTDVQNAAFDIAMPGGSFGMFNGCASQWKATPDVWGQQWGGMSTDKCTEMPKALQAGCEFRWGWFKGSDNVPLTYRSIGCPAALVQKSGCGVADGGSDPVGSDTQGADTVGTGAAVNGTVGTGSTGNGDAGPAGAGNTGTGASSSVVGSSQPSVIPSTSQDSVTGSGLGKKCKRGEKKRLKRTGDVLESVVDHEKIL